MKSDFIVTAGVLMAFFLASCGNSSETTETAASSYVAAEAGNDNSSNENSAQGEGPSSSSVAAGEITVIQIERLFGLVQTGQVLLVDSRQPLIHRLGNIGGSINLPIKKFDTIYPSVKPQLDGAVATHKVIVIYCQNEKCPYANTLAKKLSTKGYPVTIYSGGWEEWRQAGF